MTFSKSMMKKDGIFQAFEMLYWCGLRLGEMLALTLKTILAMRKKGKNEIFPH